MLFSVFLEICQLMTAQIGWFPTGGRNGAGIYGPIMSRKCTEIKFNSGQAEIFRDASFNPLTPCFFSKYISLMWDSHVMLDFPWLYNHHTILLIYSIVIIYVIWSLCGPTYMQMNFGHKWCRICNTSPQGYRDSSWQGCILLIPD